MGQPNAKEERQAPNGARHPDSLERRLSKGLNDLKNMYMSCDNAPHNEVHAEINSYPSNHNNGVQPYNRQRQPSTPQAARQAEGASPTHGQRPRGVQREGPVIQTPERGQRADPRAECSPAPAAPAVSNETVNRGVYKVGDLVELYSKSQQAWCSGSIDKVEGNWVTVSYSTAEGQAMTKIMPNGHEEIRSQGVSFAQGNENANVQNQLTPARQQAPPGAVSTPAPPPPRPQGVASPEAMPGSVRSPLNALEPQRSPQQAEPAALQRQGAPAPLLAPNLFNLPGLVSPNFFSPGAPTGGPMPSSFAPSQPDLGYVAGAGAPRAPGPMPPSPAPTAAVQPDAFSNLAQGMDLLASMRFRPPMAPQQSLSGPPGGPPGMMAQTPQPGPMTNPGFQPGIGSSPSQPAQLCPSPSAPMVQPSMQSHSLVLPAASGMAPAMTSGMAQSPPRQKLPEMDIPNKVPLVAGVERIEPEVVHQMMQNSQCVLVDLRGEDRTTGLIPGSIHCQAIDKDFPFNLKIPGLMQQCQNQSLVVFTCMYSAHRAPQCANWYREHPNPNPGQRVAILTGGFRGWQGCGLPVEQEGQGADKYAADAYALLQGVQFAQRPSPSPPMLGSYVAAGGQASGLGLVPPMPLGLSPQRWA